MFVCVECSGSKPQVPAVQSTGAVATDTIPSTDGKSLVLMVNCFFCSALTTDLVIKRHFHWLFE